MTLSLISSIQVDFRHVNFSNKGPSAHIGIQSCPLGNEPGMTLEPDSIPALPLRDNPTSGPFGASPLPSDGDKYPVQGCDGSVNRQKARDLTQSLTQADVQSAVLLAPWAVPWTEAHTVGPGRLFRQGLKPIPYSSASHCANGPHTNTRAKCTPQLP